MNVLPNQSITQFDANTVSNWRCRRPLLSKVLTATSWLAIFLQNSKDFWWTFVSGRAAKDAVRQATCKPVETIVSTVPTDERDPTVFYYPSCILIKQCGGCCAHTGTTCSPTEENEKQVTIKKTKFTGGSKLQALGDVTVTLKEHTKCRCQCKKTASDCNSLQKFIASQCRCECLNTAEAESCAKVRKVLFSHKFCFAKLVTYQRIIPGSIKTLGSKELRLCLSRH